MKDEVKRQEVKSGADVTSNLPDSVTKLSERSLAHVITEMNERKNRQNNMMVYGHIESDSSDSKVRRKHDYDAIIALGNVCGTATSNDEIIRAVRLGKYNREKPNRPLLVTFKNDERKV